MAQLNSFDVTTGVDLQEVDNAVNQAGKEIATRYDFKGSKAAIDFNRTDGKLVLTAEDDFRMRALFDSERAAPPSCTTRTRSPTPTPTTSSATISVPSS